MPHMEFLGRRWKIANDDFPVPVTMAILTRLLWIAVIIAIMASTCRSLSHCNSGWVIIFYFVLSLVLIVLSIYCEVCLVKTSMKGTMVETEQRSLPVQSQLYHHVLLVIGETAVALFGISCVSTILHVPCDSILSYSKTTIILLSFVIITQLIDVIGILCCCYLFVSSPITTNVEAIDHEDAVDVWKKRCQVTCKALQWGTCNLFGGSHIGEDLDAVANMLTIFFHHDGFLDIVPSDIAAGIILCRLDQQQSIRTQGEFAYRNRSAYLGLRAKDAPSPACSLTQIPTSPTAVDCVRLLSCDSADDIALVSSLARYSVYALAAYTHLIYLYVKPCSGSCHLAASCCSAGAAACAPSQATATSHVQGDNCCRAQHTALTQLTKHLNADLVYANFFNDTTLKPFAIFVDKVTGAVVVTVRGTLSLEDCITDAVVEPEDMTAAGQLWGFDGHNKWGHSGMLRSALRIRQDIDQSRILHRIFSNVHEPFNINTPINQRTGRQRELVVVGHSLGAGVAVLLTLLLKNEWPGVRCYSFGTPGSVCDLQTARDCSGFVTSVVLGSDIISRLSLRSLIQIRENVLDCISRARVSKMKILQALFQSFDVSTFLYDKGQEPDSPFKRSDRIHQNAAHLEKAPMYIPGKIIHYTVDNTDRCCGFKSNHYSVAECQMESFADIEIDPSMAWDHFPDRYVVELSKLSDQWSIANPTSTLANNV